MTRRVTATRVSAHLTLTATTLLAACGGAATPESSLGMSEDALVVQGGPKSSWRNTSAFHDPPKLTALLDRLRADDLEILDMASTANGAWVVSAEDGVTTSGTLPNALAYWLSWMQAQGETIRAVDVNAAGGWVIIGDAIWRSGGPVSQLTKDAITDWFAQGWAIRDLALTDTGYVMLGQGNLARYANVDADLSAFLADRLASGRKVEQVDIGFDGRWVAIAAQETAGEGNTSQLASVLRSAAMDAKHLSRLMLGPGTSFVLYSHGQATATPGSVIDAIELGAPGQPNLWRRMVNAGVPGLSIALVDGNQVVMARGYGVLKQGEEKHVLATTPFDMASLSKYVGALTVMRLDDNSSFSIDTPVVTVANAAPNRVLGQWLVNGTANPATYSISNNAISNQLTTEHFLRHMSDFVRSGGSPGFPINQSELANTTTTDYLLGFDCSTNPCGYNGANVAWTVGGLGPVAPSYDSVNFVVPQGVVEQVTGKPAAELIEDYFLTPMGLGDTTGRITSSSMLNRAAWQHGNSGPTSTRFVYPWTFAGGLWSSPSDYAELLILALNRGRDSSGVQRVSEASIERMTSVLPSGTSSFGYGLMSEQRLNLYTRDSRNNLIAVDANLWHNGSHGGQTRTHMCGNPQRRQGIVITVNADLTSNRQGINVNESRELIEYILDQFTSTLGFPGNCR